MRATSIFRSPVRPASTLAVLVLLLLQILIFFSASTARAQQLSIRHYDVSDGLAHSHVVAMHQDAKGFLWLATFEGLSRFDGYRFVNYGQQDGLGHPIINCIAEDRSGSLWVATNGGGVARLIDQNETSATSRKKFISFRVGDSENSNRVNVILFDLDDNLWCVTDGGVYRANTDQNNNPKFETILSYQAETSMTAIADRRGRLWFGIEHQLIEIVHNKIIKYGPNDQVGSNPLVCVFEDHQGRLLAANQRELYEFIPPADDEDRGRWQKWPLSLNSNQGICTITGDSAGALWIGTWNGLIKYHEGKQTLYTNTQGLSDNSISALAEDRDGNLWIGSKGGGICKLSSESIVSFTKTEGMPNQNVCKIVEDRRGHIYASIENGGLARIDESKAVPLLKSQSPPFADLDERILQDRLGNWWIGTNTGLFRFQGPELQLVRGHKFTTAEGITETPISGALYLDPRGRIWSYQDDKGLYYFDSPGDVRSYRRASPNPLPAFHDVNRVISDGSGGLWLGAHDSLGRLVANQLVSFKPDNGLPETRPRTFFLDSRGWLWIGLRYKGVSMTKEPSVETPQFVNYSTANGLASDSIWAIAEDEFGRMYFGTGKGLDRLDLATDRVRHFNTDDGLASDIVNYCLKDRRGNMWIGTTLGLSKLNPRAELNADQPAPIYITRVQIAGEEQSLMETGSLHLQAPELSASHNNLLIEYVALSFRGEHQLRYQYKLEGVDPDWSAPTEARSVNYARLAAGSYQFLVRAINQQGQVSVESASLRFRILPPIWLRWWFLATIAALTALLIYFAHRARVARLVELERVRTRIATDLHDDIGANLSLVAMLSEVARDQLRQDDVRLREWFSTIATTSRDTVDAMSDIVWAVNPKRDHLRDLTQRMHRFAGDICGARDIELQFHFSETGYDPKMGADLRREVFLIFKESINNMVRHSGCSLARVELRVEHRRLVLYLKDNGRGCPSFVTSKGHGLNSMRLRATKLGGEFKIVSSNGDGTTVILEVPLDHHTRN